MNLLQDKTQTITKDGIDYEIRVFEDENGFTVVNHKDGKPLQPVTRYSVSYDLNSDMKQYGYDAIDELVKLANDGIQVIHDHQKFVNTVINQSN